MLAAAAADDQTTPQTRLAAIQGFDIDLALFSVGGCASTLERILQALVTRYIDGEPAHRLGSTRTFEAVARRP